MSCVLVLSTSAALLVGCAEQPLRPIAAAEDASAAKAAISQLVAPSNPVAVSSGQNQIDIAWQDNSRDESRFEVHRSTSGPDGVFSLRSSAAANTTTYRDAGLTAGTQYCYVIRAVRVRGSTTTFSPFSTAACALTAPPVPVAASEATATALNSSTIAVRWTFTPSLGQQFRIDRSTDGGAAWNVIAVSSQPPFYDYATPNEQPVCYRVVAFNVSGATSPSNIACATPPAAPTNLTATLVDAMWELTWSDNSAVEDGYEVWGYSAYIQCCDSGGCDSGYSEGDYLIARLPANSTAYSAPGDPGVGPCGTHTLMVRATKGAGASTFAGIDVIP